MKYLEQIKTDNNRFVDYIKGTLIFIFFHILGQIPLTLFVISQSNLTANPSIKMIYFPAFLPTSPYF
jgi:hypothetical protein